MLQGSSSIRDFGTVQKWFKHKLMVPELYIVKLLEKRQLLMLECQGTFLINWRVSETLSSVNNGNQRYTYLDGTRDHIHGHGIT